MVCGSITAAAHIRIFTFIISECCGMQSRKLMQHSAKEYALISGCTVVKSQQCSCIVLYVSTNCCDAACFGKGTYSTAKLNRPNPTLSNSNPVFLKYVNEGFRGVIMHTRSFRFLLSQVRACCCCCGNTQPHKQKTCILCLV